MALRSYRSLDVWKKAMDLVLLAYEVCRKLPSEEKFGLASQVQRAAVSILRISLKGTDAVIEGITSATSLSLRGHFMNWKRS